MVCVAECYTYARPLILGGDRSGAILLDTLGHGEQYLGALCRGVGIFRCHRFSLSVMDGATMYRCR